MAQRELEQAPARLSGQTILDQLIRNAELGHFEMGYSILLPCIFNIYLHPEDYARLRSVQDLIKAAMKKRPVQAKYRKVSPKLVVRESTCTAPKP